eukprot:Pgem_evm1s15583
MFWEWFRKHICRVIFTVYLEYLGMVCCECAYIFDWSSALYYLFSTAIIDVH